MSAAAPPIYIRITKKSPIRSNFFPEINKQLDNTPLYILQVHNNAFFE